MKLTKYLAVAATVIAASLPSVSSAASFSCISNNTGSCATTVSPLMSWTLVGTQLSIFNNDSPTSGSFISGITFDYSTGMDVALNASQVAGVSYTMTSNDEAGIPNSLHWSVDEGAIHNKPGNKNAIQGGEKIVFTLSNVNLSNIGNSFKFGIHVQGLPQSEKLVAVTAVPEPETYAMLLAGLGLMGTIARRRKAKSA